MKTLKLRTSNGSAWRGLYLSLGGTQVARITVDPSIECGHGPVMTLGVPWVSWRVDRQELCLRFRVKAVRIPMPHVTWNQARKGPVQLRLYRLSTWFWHGMDGRYGWGGSCRRRA